ncbi:MAG: hypothetical protein R3C71_03475 [Candidatus Krumholzibacteriia bacterium]
MKSVCRAILLIALLGLPLLAPAQVSTPPATASNILQSPGGRYVFGQVSEYRKDQYLLDTQTGRLWQIVVDKNDVLSLQPVKFDQVFGFGAYLPDPLEEIQSLREWAKQQWLKSLPKEEAEDAPSQPDSKETIPKGNE